MTTLVGANTPGLERRPSVPGLVVADPGADGTALLDPRTPGVEVCYDARGQLLAYCRQEDGILRVDVPDLISFCCTPGALHVKAVPRRVLAPGLILDVYHHCVLPLVLPALGTEVLHASAVRGAAGVAAFCASSGTGKSTIAVALGRRGYALWADDAVAVDVTGPHPAAIPLPFTVRLRSGSARLLGNGAERETRTATASIDLPGAPLAMLCMLRRAPEAAGPVAIARLGAARTAQAALAHAYCFSARDPGLRRRMVRNYLTITAKVPAYEVRFRPGPEHLPALLDALEEIVGGAAPRPR